MQCQKPVTLKSGVTVNCGKCMACRINYTSSWKLRLLYELSNWDDACFVTLTYKDERVPGDYALHKKELSGFFKRLRAALDYEYGKHPIKFYACGEYGDSLDQSPPGVLHGRPHFHAIIFGLSPYDDKHKELIIDSWQHRCEDWQFDRSRGKKCALQPVTPEDIAYVCGYVQKKLSGMYADIFYNGHQKPFALMSKGLGLDFAVANAKRLKDNGFTYLNGHRITLPRYYRDKLDIELRYDEIPLPSMDEIHKQTQHAMKEFDKEIKLRHLDFNLKTAKGYSEYIIAFEKFIERRQYEIADQAFRDFQQRQKLRNKQL